jgi:FMN reductase
MNIIGISGSLSDPSRTTTLVKHIIEHPKWPDSTHTSLITIASLVEDLGRTVDPRRLPPSLISAFQTLVEADVIVIGTPIYKASYTGLLKHFFDLCPPHDLAGRVAILAATGGSTHHALALEHQIRPLASFLGLHTMPTTVFAADDAFSKYPDGTGYDLHCPAIQHRAERVIDQVQNLTSRSLLWTPAYA